MCGIVGYLGHRNPSEVIIKGEVRVGGVGDSTASVSFNLNNFLSSKRNIAMEYKEFFKDKPYRFIEEPVNSKSNYWLNAIIFKDKEDRDLFLHETNSKGVMTRPVWTLMNKLSMFKDIQCDNLDNARWLADRVVNLPSSPIVHL